MRIRHVLNVVASLLVLTGACMGIAALVSLGYREGSAATGIGLAALLTISVGLVVRHFTTFRDDIGPREGFGVVTFAWTGVALFGALPYLFTGSIEGLAPAIFESMSGFTTTGATVIRDIEALPKGVLLWRSMTHWLGGMGIIVLVIAILPFLGVGGMQLFKAEVPGPTAERLRPRITQTAKLLWGVYLGLTAAQALLYVLGGMTIFDAINHAFATLATGGFSTKNASIAAFDSRYIQYVTIVFMYLAGVNFALHLRAVAGKRPYLRDTEWRFFSGLLLLATGLLVGINLATGSYSFSGLGIEAAFRDSLFQVVSIATTTGFVSIDYEAWASGAVALIVALMFTGGMAGSTGGGIKAVRLLLMFKHMANVLRRHLHPRGVYVARVGRSVVSEDVMANVVGFVGFYAFLVLGGMLVMAMLGMDLATAFGASAATVGNIGPGLGGVGPVENYAWISSPALVVLTFLMLVGRLEIFTVLLLFHPDLWRRRAGKRRGKKAARVVVPR